jgi:hypothetical protein
MGDRIGPAACVFQIAVYVGRWLWQVAAFAMACNFGCAKLLAAYDTGEDTFLTCPLNQMEVVVVVGDEFPGVLNSAHFADFVFHRASRRPGFGNSRTLFDRE